MNGPARDRAPGPDSAQLDVLFQEAAEAVARRARELSRGDPDLDIVTAEGIGTASTEA